MKQEHEQQPQQKKQKQEEVGALELSHKDQMRLSEQRHKQEIPYFMRSIAQR